MSDVIQLPDKHITACGGVLYRNNESVGVMSDNLEVLLIFRRGFWDIPKGKLDPGESVPACAVREVSEEIGIPTPSIVRFLTLTSHLYEEKSVTVLKTTWWYAMVTGATSFTPQKSEGIQKMEWVPLTEAIERVGFENLKVVLRCFGEVMR